jgi:hypothetical protein
VNCDENQHTSAGWSRLGFGINIGFILNANVTSIAGQIDSQPDTTFNDPEQLVEEPDHLVKVETIPDIVQVINRVGRPKGPKPTFHSTPIPSQWTPF